MNKNGAFANMRLRDGLSALLVLLLLGLGGWLWLQPGGQSGDLPRLKLPALNLTTVAGQRVDLQQWRGKVLLINFWSTDCPGCIAELPDLVALQQHFAGTAFTVLGINMAGDHAAKVAEVARGYGLDYPLLMDRDGQAAREFGSVNLTPTSFLVNVEGQIVYRQVGSLPLNVWEQHIQALLPSTP